MQDKKIFAKFARFTDTVFLSHKVSIENSNWVEYWYFGIDGPK